MKKITTLISLMLIFITVISGCSSSPDKVFSDEGMSITLNENFSREELENATVCYRSLSALLIIEKHTFEELASEKLSSESSLEDFADYVIKYLDLNDNIKFEYDAEHKFLYSEYTSFVQDGDYTFVPCLFKSGDAFWIFDFCTPMLYAKDSMKDFMKWAGSVKFD